jgi:hypothetical protein
MVEEWRSVPEFEGRYEVSSEGRVRSLPRRDRLGRPVGGLILRLKDRGNGYRFITLNHDGSKTHRDVHALVALAFLGPRPDDREVRHLDGDPLNCRATNLAYGTRSENMLDKVRHGTHHEANKTHCPARHEYVPANTYWSRPRRPDLSPVRICRTCALERARRRRAGAATLPGA